MSAPWGFGVLAHGNPVFHVVTRGSCWLQVDGEPDHVALTAGDLVVLPTGRRHWVRDARDSAVTELEDILETNQVDEHLRLRYGGGGAATSLLCGWFALEGGATNPVLSALPSEVLVKGIDGRPVPWLAATLALLSAETDSDAPGAVEVLTRLADALLAQALRVTIAELLSSDGAGPLAGRDAQIASAIERIHRQPEHSWTIDELATQVALSRSAFSARFRRHVGESPKRYITRTRLAHAAKLLRDTDASLAEIAIKIGYANEFSFAKAFKRAFGVAPGRYRGQDAVREATQRAVRVQ
jgi:AraC-like DNA-binding protein